MKPSIYQVEGGGYRTRRPVTADEWLSFAERLVSENFARSQVMANPEETRRFLKLNLVREEQEIFCALFLDSQHRIIAFERLFMGTIDGASVYPREVVKKALKRNAAALIFAHNHPSGVAEPSLADRTITRRLIEALALVDIRVLDHFVIGSDEVVSFAERGLI